MASSRLRPTGSMTRQGTPLAGRSFFQLRVRPRHAGRMYRSDDGVRQARAETDLTEISARHPGSNQPLRTRGDAGTNLATYFEKRVCCLMLNHGFQMEA